MSTDNRKLNYSIKDTQKIHTGTIIGTAKDKIADMPFNKPIEIMLGKNKVMLGGLKYLCELVYDRSPSFAITTFEDDLYTHVETESDLRSTITIDNSNRNTPYVQGFNVSFDGSCGDGILAGNNVRHDIGYDFDHLIPFRCIPESLNDYGAMKAKYLHHRKVLISNMPYIEYFTKRLNISVVATTKDGSTIPDHPTINLNTDLDSRVTASFPVTIEPDELSEYFILRRPFGASGTYFNATAMFMGNEAKIRIDGKDYPTMTDSCVYAKSIHTSVAVGSNASGNVAHTSNLNVVYKILMI